MMRRWVSSSLNGLGCGIGAGALTAFLAFANPAQATLLHDQELPSDIIHGDGNQDGGFTVDNRNGVLVGLRATVRYDVSDNQPKPVFNSNGDGTFDHAAGAPQGNPDRARWNVTWSVDVTDPGSLNFLNDYTYMIGMDYDPGIGTDFVTFNPVNGDDPRSAVGVLWDNGIGTRSTTNGDGDNDVYPVNSRTELSYGALLAQNTVAQNSWNWDFFDGVYAGDFNPNVDGLYDVFFEARSLDGSMLLARSDIRVCVGQSNVDCDPIPTPEPATLALFGVGLLGIGASQWRRRRITA